MARWRLLLNTVLGLLAVLYGAVIGALFWLAWETGRGVYVALVFCFCVGFLTHCRIHARTLRDLERVYYE